MSAGSNYAANTSVTPEKSQAEIFQILRRYGASRFGSGFDDEFAFIMFEVNNRRVRFDLRLPQPAEFGKTETGRPRSEKQRNSAYEQETRRRWRALALVIKAKLEAVATGIVTFDAEFLAHLVLPDGRTTVGQWLIPEIETTIETGKLPPMLYSGK